MTIVAVEAISFIAGTAKSWWEVLQLGNPAVLQQVQFSVKSCHGEGGNAQRFTEERNASWCVLNHTYHHQTRCKSKTVVESRISILQRRNCHYQNEITVAPDYTRLTGNYGRVQ